MTVVEGVDVAAPPAVGVPGAPVAAAGVRTSGSSAKRLGRRLLATLGQALLSLAVIVIAWQGLISAFHINDFISRGPLDVWRYLTDPAHDAARETLRKATMTTFRDAAIGLLAGTIAAVVFAVVFNLWRTVESAFMPIAMALRSVPLVAMTPLICLIFGRGLVAVTVIAGIVTFFPTLVNVSLALRSVPRSSIDLMRANGASPAMTLRKVQLPASLPALFASARIAAPLALIGALLAEWLSTGQGLGYLMLQSVSTFETDQMWSAVTIVTFASVVLYGIISAVEQVVLTRYAPEQTGRVA